MTKRQTKQDKRRNTTGVTPKADIRNRIQFRFWLDAFKKDELQLIKDLHHFKSQRKFARLIRDALRLFFSLLLGDVSVLNELFPGILATLEQNVRFELEADNIRLKAKYEGLLHTLQQQETEIDELQRQLSTRQTSTPVDIQARLDSIEKLLQSQGKTVNQDTMKPVGLKALQPVAVGNAPGPKLLNVPQFAPPPVDDDDDNENLLEVRRDESAAARTTANFLKSVLALTEEQPDKPRDLSKLSPRQRAQLERDNQ